MHTNSHNTGKGGGPMPLRDKAVNVFFLWQERYKSNVTGN